MSKVNAFCYCLTHGPACLLTSKLNQFLLYTTAEIQDEQSMENRALRTFVDQIKNKNKLMMQT